MLAVFLAHAAVGYWLWRRIKPVDIAPKPAWILALGMLFFLIIHPMFYYGVIKGKSAGDLLAKMQTKMEPAVPWQLVLGYTQYRQQLGSMQALLDENAELPPLADFSDAHANQPATLVLVIGESTNRQHMSLYGYQRATTPLLDGLKNELHLFQQVVAPRPYTIESLQQVLTFADQENPDLHLTKPNLLNIMKQAGYKSYWITNQQTVTRRNTMLTTFSKQTDVQIYLNNARMQDSRQYDGDVIFPFNKALQDPSPRKFIVVHLLGTHMQYIFRYPPEYNRFTDSSGLDEVFDGDQVEVINTYDNAVLYNDFVVSSLIKGLAASRQPGLLTYFSDHGEDVFDSGNHDVLGRNEASPTLPMYAVPFFVWKSPEWRFIIDNAAVETLSDDVLDRPYSSAHFIHTWADLAGLRFAGYEPEKSLINPAFKPRPLLVGDPKKPHALKVLPAGK
jgi:heptose-I-phosphate ethanolaminephosphotransferase